MNTTRDPIALARAALAAGGRAFPPYSHPKSPHKFTQPQLFAMLALRQFLRIDYRGLVAWLRRWAELREVLGLERLPHYSTLCRAEDRLLKKRAPRASSTRRSTSRESAA